MDLFHLEVEMDVICQTIQELSRILDLGLSMSIDYDFLDCRGIAMNSQIDDIFELIIWHINHEGIIEIAGESFENKVRDFIYKIKYIFAL